MARVARRPPAHDGEHRFLLEPLDGGARTRLVHDEAFSGRLVRPINWYVGGPAREGFLATDEAPKARVETLVAAGELDVDDPRDPRDPRDRRAVEVGADVDDTDGAGDADDAAA